MMRVPVSCPECFRSDGIPSEELHSLDVNSSKMYEFTCSKGHKAAAVCQQQTFEFLFELGVHATIDGYYREAVSCFAASLERFYEFAIRVIVRASKVRPKDADDLDDSAATKNLFEDCWKLLSRSERQFGAFVIAWALQFAEKPLVLGSTKSEFRNDVVHNGLIPSREKAIEFGQLVADIIRPQMRRLLASLREEVRQETFQSMPRLETHTTVSVPTLVSLTIVAAEHQERSVEDHVDVVERRRGRIGW